MDWSPETNHWLKVIIRIKIFKWANNPKDIKSLLSALKISVFKAC